MRSTLLTIDYCVVKILRPRIARMRNDKRMAAVAGRP
jgi:hypothetical protein